MGQTLCFVSSKNNIVLKDKINSIIDIISADYSELIINNESNLLDMNDVENIVEFVNSKPLQGDHKLLIVYDFDTLSVIGQNKLLKTIEDNFLDTTQIYICSNPNKLLRTITSRLVIYNVEQSIDYDSNLSSRYSDYIDKYLVSQEDIDVFLSDESKTLFFLSFTNLLENKDYKNCFLKYTSFKEKDNNFKDLVMDIIFKCLYLNKDYNKFIDLLDYEKRYKSNCNKQLQVEAFIVELIRGE